MGHTAILSEGVGYAVILGFGAFFSVLMSLLAYWARRYMGESNSAEFFNTAGRSLKTGLTAAAVVSAWTWAAALLQSSTVAYAYGVSGPYWFGAGACVQIILFSVLAIMLKRRAPAARSYCEIMKVRYGPFVHKVYVVVAIAINTTVMITLMLGGSAVASALTGMDIYAAIWLTPVGVLAYTMAGGLKATFLTDYAHAIIIFIMIMAFMFAVYASSPLIGSVSKMYDLLEAAAALHPVDGNAEGSYLTMKSTGGSTFAVIQITTAIGMAFADTAIWQRAVAARPEATTVSYIIGGVAWFVIPFGLGTTVGLAAVALETDPSFPTYPNRMTGDQVSAGLVLPFGAAAIGGSGGAAAIFIMVYMAVTSCMSAELVGVTTVCEYDIYRTYFNPTATDVQQKKVGRIALVIYVILLTALCSVLNSVGVDLGFIYLFMGFISCPAVAPLVLTLVWKGTNKWGALLPLIMVPVGFAAWVGYAKQNYGDTSKESLMMPYPSVCGNVVALVGSLLIAVFASLLTGEDNYDWEKLRTGIPTEDDISISPELDARLRQATKLALWTAGSLALIFLVLFPVPLEQTSYIYTKGFFGFWVGVAITWAIVDVVVICLWPIWESRNEVKVTAKGFWLDITTGFKLTTQQVQDRIEYIPTLQSEIQRSKQTAASDSGFPNKEDVPLSHDDVLKAGVGVVVASHGSSSSVASTPETNYVSLAAGTGTGKDSPTPPSTGPETDPHAPFGNNIQFASSQSNLAVVRDTLAPFHLPQHQARGSLQEEEHAVKFHI